MIALAGYDNVLNGFISSQTLGKQTLRKECGYETHARI